MFFRERALQKLSTTDQLDKAVTITSPLGWLAIITLGLIVIFALLWGIFGAVYHRSVGWGMLIRGGQLSIIEALTDGRIKSITIMPGDYVTVGEIVGKIYNHELSTQIRNSREKIEFLEDALKEVKELNKKTFTEELEYIDKMIATKQKNIDFLKGRMKWYKDMVDKEDFLRKRGSISEATYEKEWRVNLDNLTTEINTNIGDVENLEYKKVSVSTTQRKEILDREFRIKEEKKNLELLLNKQDEETQLRSPVSGHVIEVNAIPGDVVKNRQVIATITPKTSEPMIAIVYFPQEVGKKIRLGMTAQITPLYIEAENYGSIVGVVAYVSKYPCSKAEMVSTFQNESLVNAISKNASSAYEARILLLPDPNTYSGFQWTSSKGPSREIDSGSMCSASVVTMKEPPLNLILKFFRKHFLGIGQREEGVIQALK